MCVWGGGGGSGEGGREGEGVRGGGGEEREGGWGEGRAGGGMGRGVWGGREGGCGRWLKTTEMLLAESCHEQVIFESGLKQRKGRRISEIG